MEKIELTADEIKVIKQQLNGEIEVWNADDYQQKHLTSVIDKANALLENSGRKPSVYKYIKDITGKKVAPEMSKEDYYKVIRFLMESTPETLEGLVKNKDGTPNKKTPVWVLNVVSAINADIRYGRTYTVDSLFDRVFGKPTQQIESEVNAQVTNNSMDLSALTTDELLQYNSLLEKIKAGNGTK